VIAIGDDIPGQSCIKANAHALARYIASCQEAGLVPVVEPWRIHLPRWKQYQQSAPAYRQFKHMGHKPHTFHGA
jgi:fructose-bisphosphate aldolase class 1